MKITRRSPFSSKLNTMEIPVTEAKLNQYLKDPNAQSIQIMFPLLSANEREFIKTGITADEWEETFPDK